MSKTLQKYIKYTERELEEYAEAEGSCVKKVNTQWHLALAPYALNNIKDSILTYIRRKKVGSFDIHLNGIILEIKNIKLLGVAGALRADDPRMHVKVKADCYIFQPEVGAILSGIVRHIGKKHVGALIYRVFNANLRFETKVNENLVKLDSEIKFRIKDFNLQNVFPYIEGEILSDRTVASKNNITKMDSDSTIDSGIEERDSNELDNIINLIKQEPMSEAEGTKSPAKKQQKSNKKKREFSESTAETSTKSKNKEKKRKLVDKKNETKVSKSVNMSINSVQIKKEPTN